MPKCGGLPRHPPRVGGIVPFLDQPVGYVVASSAKGEEGRRNQTKNWNRRDVLAASGRRASKQDGMPVSDDRASLAHRGRCDSDPDQENLSHGDCERHHRVHHDAQRTMIGVAANRMHVRHLGHGQNRQ